MESTVPFSVDSVGVKGPESHFTRDETNISIKDHGENKRNKGLYWFIHNQVSTLQLGKSRRSGEDDVFESRLSVHRGLASQYVSLVT